MPPIETKIKDFEDKLLTGQEIRKALKKIRPYKIAVAYVGNNWDKWVDKDNLEEIILAPILGTNPGAINSIIEQVGIKNVHFLDDLHAKLYIGQDAVLIGSCNLSENGLAGDGEGGHGLIEIAYTFTNPEKIAEANHIFNKYKTKAKQQYKTKKEKEEQIQRLAEIHQHASSKGFISGNNQSIKHSSKSIPCQPFQVVWFDETCAKEDHGAETVGIGTDEIKDFTLFHLENEVAPGTWLLRWRGQWQNEKLKKVYKGNIQWTYVDGIFKSKSRDHEDYSFCAYELNQKSRKARSIKNQGRKPSEPFELSKTTKDAIHDLILSIEKERNKPNPKINKDLFHILPKEDTIWITPKGQRVSRAFYQALMERLSNGSRSTKL